MAKQLKFNYELKNRSEEMTLLSITFTWQQKSNKVCLGLKVPSADWDKDTHRITITSKQTQAMQRKFKQINRFLCEFEKAIAEIHVDLIDWGFESHKNLDAMANRVKGKLEILQSKEQKEQAKKEILPIPFFRQVLEKMPTKVIKRTSTVINPKTIQHHHIVLKRVIAFFEYKKWGDGTWDLFTDKFETLMMGWMLGVKKYSANTAPATFSVMKVWLNEAEEQGLIKDKSFHSWQSKGVDVEHVYLNEDELKRIYALKFTNSLKSEYKIDSKSSIEQSRDLFILAANLGLRLGDLGKLNSANWNIGDRRVQIHTTKTSKTVYIPLSSVVIEIYNKYNGQFPKPIDKSKYNRHIQLICKMAGIDEDIRLKQNRGGHISIMTKKKYELIASHTARRSFATNLYKRCKDSRMVMQFTGHTTEENFRKYICIDKMEMADMAEQYFD